MRTLYDGPPMSFAATGRAIRLVKDALTGNGVSRARDLPEEARVRLYRRLNSLLRREREAHWARQIHSNPVARLWRRGTEFVARIRL